MKECKYIVVVLLTGLSLLSKGQDLLYPRHSKSGIEFSNNITSFPVTTYPQLFYSQFHPGLDVYRSWKWNKSLKNQVWYSGNFGGYYHRFIQTAIRLYPSIEYERIFSKRLSTNIGMGAGYSLAFENMETFELQDDGTYKLKKIVARSQYLVMFGFGCNYALKKDDQRGMRISLRFRTFIQGPFVSGYVPMLPVNSFMVGMIFPIKTTFIDPITMTE